MVQTMSGGSLSEDSLLLGEAVISVLLTPSTE